MASPDQNLDAKTAARQSELESHMSRILDRIIRRSNALDTESLCLAKGVACWTVRADVHVVDSDGNLVDAACLAILTALLHFRLPESAVRDGKISVFGVEEKVPVSLNLTKLPLAITYQLFGGGGDDDGTLFIVDATAKEEAVSEGSLVIAVDKTGEIALLSKSEGVPADPLSMVQCSNLALARVKELNKLMARRLEEDSRLRESRRSGLSSVEAAAANERVNVDVNVDNGL